MLLEKAVLLDPYIALILLYIFGSCTNERIDDSISSLSKETAQDQTYEIQVIRLTSFDKEVRSNGKLKSSAKSVLKFQIPGKIERIYFKNGESVKVGEIIANLHPYSNEMNVRIAEQAVKVAELESEDLTLSYLGLKTVDSIPKRVKSTIDTKSGKGRALIDLEIASENLRRTQLRSPLAGKVANIYRHNFEDIDPSESFCTVIDDSEFEVEFSVLESEIPHVSIHQRILIEPLFNEEHYIGAITEINPVVNESGLVLVKASVRNNGSLWEGMNVKVIIHNPLKNQFVVPKTALVFRQNQNILFRYKHGHAVWTYVKPLFENSTSYAVIGDLDNGGRLEEGDSVIISGVTNLVHDAAVTLTK